MITDGPVVTRVGVEMAGIALDRNANKKSRSIVGK